MTIYYHLGIDLLRYFKNVYNSMLLLLLYNLSLLLQTSFFLVVMEEIRKRNITEL